MSLAEEKLIGWLCMYRYQSHLAEAQACVPGSIIAAWAERGWIMPVGDIVGNGDDVAFECGLTPEGAAVTDLNCADWGITPSWVETT